MTAETKIEKTTIFKAKNYTHSKYFLPLPFQRFLLGFLKEKLFGWNEVILSSLVFFYAKLYTVYVKSMTRWGKQKIINVATMSSMETLRIKIFLCFASALRSSVEYFS